MTQPAGESEAGNPPSQFKAPVPCYNCGSPDHLFNACPEPTRATPAGLAAAAAAKAAATQAQSTGNGYAGSQITGYGPNQGLKNQKYQGPVVTKYPARQAPVITRYAPPSAYQSQQPPSTYAPPNQPPYHRQQPIPQQNFGQYGQNPGSQVSQPPPPPPGYGQYGQHYGPPAVQPPPPGNYGHYGQPEYHTSQSYYSQQVPQNYPQYPSQHASAHSYQNAQQPVYLGPQGNYQATPVNQPTYNGYQQPDYADYQYPSNAQYDQVEGPEAYQPTHWGQPPPESYGQQQSGQDFSEPVQPYYAQPQHQYSHDGSYSHMPASAPHDISQMAPPVQQTQQYVEAQYDAPIQQYSSEHLYHENNQSRASDSQFTQTPYPSVSTYPHPHIHDPSLNRESRSASVVSQAQGVFQPNSPEVSDEEEIEWMLERHLTRRMAKSGMTKTINELTADEYYSLLCEDSTTSCDPIAQPLPDIFNEDLILPPKYNATGVISKFVSPTNAAEFKKSIRDQSPLNSFGRDPAFLDVDAETWCSEFGRWVDDRCRIALGYQVDLPESKSRKRTSSSREGEATAQRSRGENRYSYGQSSHNKRTRIDGSDYSQSNPPASGSMSTSVSAAQRESTPSADREATPSFDIGEGGQDGEEDPWAVEPGEGLLQVDRKEPVDHECPPSNGYGNRSGNTYGSQQSNYNRGPRQNSNGSSDHAQATRRQDSGYISARSSFTSSNGHNTSYAGAHHAGQNGYQQVFNQTNFGNYPRQSHNQEKTKFPSPMSSDSDALHQRPEDSPLTPTSTELLGQNLLPLQDQAKGSKHEGVKYSDVKIRRPKPHIEPAYSRRW